MKLFTVNIFSKGLFSFLGSKLKPVLLSALSSYWHAYNLDISYQRTFNILEKMTFLGHFAFSMMRNLAHSGLEKNLLQTKQQIS
jgi:hypothetical protein